MLPSDKEIMECELLIHHILLISEPSIRFTTFLYQTPYKEYSNSDICQSLQQDAALMTFRRNP